MRSGGFSTLVASPQHFREQESCAGFRDGHLIYRPPQQHRHADEVKAGIDMAGNNDSRWTYDTPPAAMQAAARRLHHVHRLLVQRALRFSWLAANLATLIFGGWPVACVLPTTDSVPAVGVMPRLRRWLSRPTSPALCGTTFAPASHRVRHRAPKEWCRKFASATIRCIPRLVVVRTGGGEFCQSSPPLARRNIHDDCSIAPAWLRPCNVSEQPKFDRSPMTPIT